MFSRLSMIRSIADLRGVVRKHQIAYSFLSMSICVLSIFRHARSLKVIFFCKIIESIKRISHSNGVERYSGTAQIGRSHVRTSARYEKWPETNSFTYKRHFWHTYSRWQLRLPANTQPNRQCLITIRHSKIHCFCNYSKTAELDVILFLQVNMRHKEIE